MDDWETRLMTAATNRVVRPFEWGLDWAERWPIAQQLPRNGHSPSEYLGALSAAASGNSDEFYGYTTPSDFELRDNLLRFTSPVATQHEENNLAHATWFPA